MKNFKVYAFCLLLVFSAFLLGGCSTNRPTLSSINPNSSSDESYFNVSFDSGIIISSTTTLEKSNNQKLKAGTLIKVSIDEKSTIQNLSATDGNGYYFDAVSNKVISGIKVNNLEISLNHLDTPITISDDTYISLISSNIKLHSILLCYNNNNLNPLNTFTKFNKSKTFRNSLFSSKNEIIQNDDIYYLSFDENYEIAQTNISSKSKVTENSLNLTIEAFYESIQTAIAFVYQDEFNHLFITEPYTTDKYSDSKMNTIENKYSLIDGSNKTLSIVLAKYYLPQ